MICLLLFFGLYTCVLIWGGHGLSLMDHGYGPIPRHPGPPVEEVFEPPNISVLKAFRVSKYLLTRYLEDFGCLGYHHLREMFLLAAINLINHFAQSKDMVCFSSFFVEPASCEQQIYKSLGLAEMM